MSVLRVNNNKGFSLIEMIVVIAIIAILIALLLPAVQQAREAARRTQCKNNLKQLGLAMHNYHDVHGVLPPGTFTHTEGRGFGNGRDAWSWFAFVLPFIDQAPMYNSLDFNLPINGTPTAAAELRKGNLPAMLCPSDDAVVEEAGAAEWQSPLHNFVVCFGNTRMDNADDSGVTGLPGMFEIVNAKRLDDVKDGTSNTLMVGEIITPDDVNTWNSVGRTSVAMGSGFTTFLTPNSAANDRSNNCYNRLSGGQLGQLCTDHGDDDWRLNVHAIRSLHVGGAQVTLGDGSCRFISENIDLNLYRALGTRNGGETVGEF